MTNSIAQKFNVFTLLKFAFPTMVMMVFMSLYTIVDGIFVSRLVGSNALSAVNIVYPVISLLIACGIMLSTGGSDQCAHRNGDTGFGTFIFRTNLPDSGRNPGYYGGL